jgi:hypothetical protein
MVEEEDIAQADDHDQDNMSNDDIFQFQEPAMAKLSLGIIRVPSCREKCARDPSLYFDGAVCCGALGLAWLMLSCINLKPALR